MTDAPPAIGSRVVIVCTGDIGYVEEQDEDQGWLGVRLLTPNNEPSCLVSWAPAEIVRPVGDNVVPMGKSKEWWAQAREFCSAIEAALEEELTDD